MPNSRYIKRKKKFKTIWTSGVLLIIASLMISYFTGIILGFNKEKEVFSYRSNSRAFLQASNAIYETKAILYKYKSTKSIDDYNDAYYRVLAGVSSVKGITSEVDDQKYIKDLDTKYTHIKKEMYKIANDLKEKKIFSRYFQVS